MTDNEKHQLSNLDRFNRDTTEEAPGQGKHLEVKYNKSISEYYNHLQNPTFRNNSVGMKGVMSRGDGAAGGDLELPAINQTGGGGGV